MGAIPDEMPHRRMTGARCLAALRVFALGALLAIAGLGLAGCSAIGAFNAVASGDAGSELAASDIAYGEHPRQRLDVYAPAKRGASMPVIFFIYGGSWDSGSRSDYAFAGRALAAQGYVIVVADYRLVPEVQFPDFLDDNARALRWLTDNVSRFGGDPGRVALVGHSAGAYNAMMLALDARYLRRAGVAASSIKAIVGLSGPYDFFPFTSPAARAAMGKAPDPLQTQPVTFARSGAPPMFLAHGLDDTTVNPRNTATMAARLRLRGAIVTERRYPGLDHADTLLAIPQFTRAKRQAVFDDMMRFLGEHIPAAQR